jgi:hypothetical protein
VLLVLCTVLNDTPFLNEPGITKTHLDYDNYNTILKFKNIEVAIINMLTNEDIVLLFSEFTQVMNNYFLTNYDKIINIVDKEIEQQIMNNNPDTIIITTCVYQMSARINYKELKKKLIKCHNNIKLGVN